MSFEMLSNSSCSVIRPSLTSSLSFVAVIQREITAVTDLAMSKTSLAEIGAAMSDL